MAYQTRGRDPLFDQSVTETIEKRGRELIGIALIVCGLLAAAMIGSYTPTDPNWMMASDGHVQNWLGSFGASLSAPIFMIVGWASWGIVVLLLVWGLRFLFHFGHRRALGRLIFAPIAIGLLSIYAASHEPAMAWFKSHSFGYGGLFGDTVMGAFLTLLPLNSAFGIKAISLLMGVGVLIVGGFSIGITRAEVNRFMRGAGVGFIMIYAGIMALLGRGAQGAFALARDYQERREEESMQAQLNATMPPVGATQAHGFDAGQAQGGGDLSQLFSAAQSQQQPQGRMIKRAEPMPQGMPERELVEPLSRQKDVQMPTEESIQARISGAIVSRLKAERNIKPPVLQLQASPFVAPEVAVAENPPMPEEMPMPEMRAEVAPEMRQEIASEVDAASAFMHDAYDHDPYDEVLDDAPLPPLSQPMDIPSYTPKKVVQPDVRKPLQPSQRAKQEAQPSLAFEDKSIEFELPPLNLLEDAEVDTRFHLSDEALEENARMLENVLDDYGVKGEIVSVRPGPVVTMYELEPAPGLKASRVVGLADDIARSMSALSARVSTVPGRTVIGIELPNENREKVMLREILASRDFDDSKLRLPLALGKDIGGDAMVANLAKMPHLLIAGTTGSGKSVAINTMILSLLYKLTPQECRMIMIDPKMLELSVYDGIPHLLSPVVTDPKKAVVALKWAVGEMEDRYRKMSKMGVRNIEGYNGRVREALEKGEMFSRTVQTGFDEETGDPIFETEENTPELLPYIVVVVDEMADLMMVAGKEIEACIQRLAQMARASGIHLIMATQRPSVDVITGTIKSNFPTRISFQVTSKIDSRTILGEMGAEQLLGMGDMLYMAGGSKVTRCHGPFVSDEEVEEVVNHLKAFGAPDYVSGVVDGPDEDKENNIDAVLGLGGNTDSEDALYDTAVQIVLKDRKCSTSYIQRKLSIGYNKAAKLVEQMEDQGVVSAANHVGKREILVPEQN